VRQPGLNRARGIVRLAQGLMLAGAPGVVGCGEPHQGTVQVATEARKELTPHAGTNAKDRQRQSIAGKSFNIKDRNKAASSE
jgi:hypothetical protein